MKDLFEPHFMSGFIKLFIDGIIMYWIGYWIGRKSQ